MPTQDTLNNQNDDDSSSFNFSDDDFSANDFKVITNESKLETATNRFKANSSLMKPFIQADGLNLLYASDDLKNDVSVVTAAVTQNGLALQHASDDLKNDVSVVTAAVKQNDLALQHASDDLKNDVSVVTAAVTQNGLALQYASENLKKDKEIVTAAVTQNGLALQHASENLKKDKDIVTAAVTQNGLALKFIPIETVIKAQSKLNTVKHNFKGIVEKSLPLQFKAFCINPDKVREQYLATEDNNHQNPRDFEQKRDLIVKLDTYMNKRRTNNSDYGNIFARFFKPACSLQNKTEAAKKLIKRLSYEDGVKFTADEQKALSDGKLGTLYNEALKQSLVDESDSEVSIAP